MPPQHVGAAFVALHQPHAQGFDQGEEGLDNPVVGLDVEDDVRPEAGHRRNAPPRPEHADLGAQLAGGGAPADPVRHVHQDQIAERVGSEVFEDIPALPATHEFRFHGLVHRLSR